MTPFRESRLFGMPTSFMNELRTKMGARSVPQMQAMARKNSRDLARSRRRNATPRTRLNELNAKKTTKAVRRAKALLRFGR